MEVTVAIGGWARLASGEQTVVRYLSNFIVALVVPPTLENSRFGTYVFFAVFCWYRESFEMHEPKKKKKTDKYTLLYFLTKSTCEKSKKWRLHLKSFPLFRVR